MVYFTLSYRKSLNKYDRNLNLKTAYKEIKLTVYIILGVVLTFLVFKIFMLVVYYAKIPIAFFTDITTQKVIFGSIVEERRGFNVVLTVFDLLFDFNISWVCLMNLVNLEEEKENVVVSADESVEEGFKLKICAYFKVQKN